MLFFSIFLFSFISFFPPLNVSAEPVTTAVAFEIAKKVLIGSALKRCLEMGADNFNRSSFASELSKTFNIDKNGIVTPVAWATNKIPFLKGLRKFAMMDDGAILDACENSGKGFCIFPGDFSTYVLVAENDGAYYSPYSRDSLSVYNFQGPFFVYRQTSIKPMYHERTVNYWDQQPMPFYTNLPFHNNYPNSVPGYTVNSIYNEWIVHQNDVSIYDQDGNFYIDTPGKISPGTPSSKPGTPVDGVDGEEGESKGWSLWDFVKGIWSLIKGLVKGIGSILDFVLNLGAKILKFLGELIIPSDFSIDNYKNIKDFGGFSFFGSMLGEIKDKVGSVPDIAPSFSFPVRNVDGSYQEYIADFNKIFEHLPGALDVIRVINSGGIIFIFVLWIKRRLEEISDSI